MRRAGLPPCWLTAWQPPLLLLLLLLFLGVAQHPLERRGTVGPVGRRCPGRPRKPQRARALLPRMPAARHRTCVAGHLKMKKRPVALLPGLAANYLRSLMHASLASPQAT